MWASSTFRVGLMTLHMTYSSIFTSSLAIKQMRLHNPRAYIRVCRDAITLTLLTPKSTSLAGRLYVFEQQWPRPLWRQVPVSMHTCIYCPWKVWTSRALPWQGQRVLKSVVHLCRCRLWANLTYLLYTRMRREYQQLFICGTGRWFDIQVHNEQEVRARHKWDTCWSYEVHYDFRVYQLAKPARTKPVAHSIICRSAQFYDERM